MGGFAKRKVLNRKDSKSVDDSIRRRDGDVTLSQGPRRSQARKSRLQETLPFF